MGNVSSLGLLKYRRFTLTSIEKNVCCNFKKDIGKLGVKITPEGFFRIESRVTKVSVHVKWQYLHPQKMTLEDANVKRQLLGPVKRVCVKPISVNLTIAAVQVQTLGNPCKNEKRRPEPAFYLIFNRDLWSR